MLLDLAAGNARTAKRFGHLAGINGAKCRLAIIPTHVDSLGVMGEVIEIETALLARGSDDIADLVGGPRLTVRGAAHHLILLAELRGTNELGKVLVQHSHPIRAPNR